MHQCTNAPMYQCVWHAQTVPHHSPSWKSGYYQVRRATKKPTGPPEEAIRDAERRRCQEATCNMLGGDGCLSAAGKARRCFSPTCAPAGGEQESAGEQHAREAGAAQRDEQRAPGDTVGG